MKYVARLKKWLILAWLLIPVALVSYHYGPGQKELAWKTANEHRNAARAFEKEGQWDKAAEEYGKAMSNVPLNSDDASAAALARDQLRLAQINAAFNLGKLDVTLTDLRQFVEQVAVTHGEDSPLMYDARDLLGRVHFNTMIAMRLEAAEESVWMKQWELSRQNFRFLAEHSSPRRNGLDRKNLEVVIKSAELPPPPVPPVGGGASGGANATALTTIPPPPNATAPPAAGNPPPDARAFSKQESLSETNPPEFELGS
jgi:hypothetical protein